MGRYCSVPGCSTDSQNFCDEEGRTKVVFKFPYKNEFLFEKWLKYLPSSLRNPSKHSRICEDHFEECFKIENDEGIRLRKDAYPTKFSIPENYIPRSRKRVRLIQNEDNCRFCLCKFDGDRIKITESIERRITNLTQIELRMSEVYASNICKRCSEQLNISYTFRKMVIENQNKLYKAFSSFEVQESQECSDESDENPTTPYYPIKNENDEIENVEIKVEKEFYDDLEQDYSENAGFLIPHEVFEQFPKVEEDYSQEGDDYQNWTLESYVSDTKSERKRRKLKISRKSDKPKATVPCPECGKGFRSHSLRAHIDRIHKKLKNYECDLCGHKSYYKKSLLFHFLAIHLKEKNFSCRECGKNFSTPGSLINHRFTVHEKKTYKKQDKFDCSQCFKTFAKKYSLDRHILKVHFQVRVNDYRSEESKSKKKEKVLCPYCGETFKRDSLRAHVDRKHLQKKNFCCDLCGHRAYYKNNLRYHILAVHLKDRSYQCKQCGKLFSTPATLTNHKFTTHNRDESIVFNCRLCNKNYSRKSHLERHIKQVHLREGKFVCTIDNCGKFFNCKTKFKNHQAMHGEPTIPCEECGKLFHNEDNLRHHKNYHNKNFNCSMCEKSFPTKNTFDCHLKVHLGQRDYPCNQCDKSYFRKSHLDRHVLHYHMNVKAPYRKKPQLKDMSSSSTSRDHPHPMGLPMLEPGPMAVPTYHVMS